MIYLVNKYHKVNGVEVSNAEKVEKSDPTLAYETALEKFYELNKNYMADKTVEVWKTSVLCPMDMTIKKTDGYERPTAEPEPIAE